MTASVPDWREFTLGDLLRFSNGINADKSAYGAGVPFANVLEVITHESIAEADIPGRIAIAPKLRRRYEVKSGDVLFNRTSETPDEVGLSSVYLGTQPIVFGGFVFRGQPVTDELTTPYSKYAFRSAVVRNQVIARGQGGIRANIGQRDLKSVTVRLPSHPEQSAIATALDDVSALIATVERQIAKKQAIKEGLIQHLLTGRIRLPGYGGEWAVERLADLGVTVRGVGYKPGDLSPHRSPSTVELLRANNVQGGSLDLADVQHVDRARVRPDQYLRAGDVLVCAANGSKRLVGKAAPVRDLGGESLTFGAFMMVFRPACAAVVPAFAALHFQTKKYRDWIEVLLAGSSINNLRPSDLGALEIAVPGRDEQSGIVRLLTDVETEIQLLFRRLVKARQVKQGMMQELLNGRTRLPVKESVA